MSKSVEGRQSRPTQSNEGRQSRPTQCKDNYIVIVDYNNASRIPDVRAMVEYARSRYGLSTVLIRGKLDPIDLELADDAFALDLSSPTFVEEALRRLNGLSGFAIGIFPFSDRSVLGASRLAERLNLPVDSAYLASAALSKREYRRKESEFRDLLKEQFIKVPDSAPIRSLQELKEFARKSGRDFILKPSCEGNNRGVLRLSPYQDLGGAFQEVEQYLPQGLIAEELIDFPEEYSFDGIAHLSFITQKVSADGRYPVERGQTVPAPIPSKSWAAIHRAGSFANVIVGQRLGPFHNEVKLNPSNGVSAVIEPNRRPAGMKIWNLASKVYGMNFYHLWLDQVLSGKLPLQMPKAQGVAAIRMLGAPRSGELVGFSLDQIDNEKLKRELSEGLDGEWFDFEISARNGIAVHEVPQDNSHFLGSICLYSKNPGADLEWELDLFESRWNRFIEGFVEVAYASYRTSLESS